MKRAAIVCSILVAVGLIAVHGQLTPTQPCVQLSWNASSATNVGPLAYKVYYGVGTRQYTNTISVGAILSATVSGLVRGTTYYFAVTAISTNALESDFSNEVNYTPPLPPAPPTVLQIIDGN